MRRSKLNPYASEYLPRPFSAPPNVFYEVRQNFIFTYSKSTLPEIFTFDDDISSSSKTIYEDSRKNTSHRIRNRLKQKYNKASEDNFLFKLGKRIELRGEILEKRSWSMEDLSQVKKKLEELSKHSIKNSEIIEYIQEYKNLSNQIKQDCL